MNSQQLDLFYDSDQLVMEEVQHLKKAQNKLRRGTFATMGELYKHILDLQALHIEVKADIERIETLLLRTKE